MFGFMRTKACQRHYCGVCKTIGAEFGQGPRMLLNHDTVLVAEIMTALDPRSGCHPALMRRNCFRMPKAGEAPLPLRYAAATTILLASSKVRDHVADTGKAGWRLLDRLLRRGYRRASDQLAGWGLPVTEIESRLEQQSAIEATPGASMSEYAGPTAFATAAVCGSAAVAMGRLDAVAPMERFGESFGRLIYVLDAWHDHARDAATRQFNAIRSLYPSRDEARPEIDAAAVEVASAIDALPLPDTTRGALRMRFEASLNASLEGAKHAKRKMSDCLPNCLPDACDDCCCGLDCCCDCDICGACGDCSCCCDSCDCGGCDCS